MKIKVKKEKSGGRLDKFLSVELSDYSRSQLQKMIKNGAVKVNDGFETAHYTVGEGDLIEIDLTPREPESVKDEAQTREKKELFKELQIIKEVEDYIIINKPAGLAVHQAPGLNEPTLVDYLLERYPEVKDVGEDEIRPGIVHRLDKEVSGLMVVARNEESFFNLKKQFQKRMVVKEYVAIVHGKIENDFDTIDFPIKRSAKGYKMAAVPKSYNKEEAREAVTHLSVLERYDHITKVKLSIETGRTHQIRVHMHAYAHPIVGDPLYSTKDSRRKDEKLIQKRGFENKLYLKSVYLEFKDINGETQSFSLSKDF